MISYSNFFQISIFMTILLVLEIVIAIFGVVFQQEVRVFLVVGVLSVFSFAIVFVYLLLAFEEYKFHSCSK